MELICPYTINNVTHPRPKSTLLYRELGTGFFKGFQDIVAVVMSCGSEATLIVNCTAEPNTELAVAYKSE